MRVQGVQFCCAQLKAVVALACRIITFSIAAVQTIVRKVFPTIRSIFYFIRLIRSLKIDRMVFKVLRTWLEGPTQIELQQPNLKILTEFSGKVDLELVVPASERG